jgi:hypothetical protein
MERQKGHSKKNRGLTEIIEHGGKRYAEIIRKSLRVEKTTFFSPADSSMQLGLLAHKKGFKETPHSHKKIKRTISDLQQILVIQRGKAAIDFFNDEGTLFDTAILDKGDAVLLMNGVHSLRALEDLQCISVKQGPFLGDENDKVEI